MEESLAYQFPGCNERCLVAHVADVCAGEAGGEGGQLAGEVGLVQLGLERAQVDLEDGGAALEENALRMINSN